MTGAALESRWHLFGRSRRAWRLDLVGDTRWGKMGRRLDGTSRFLAAILIHGEDKKPARRSCFFENFSGYTVYTTLYPIKTPYFTGTMMIIQWIYRGTLGLHSFQTKSRSQTIQESLESFISCLLFSSKNCVAFFFGPSSHSYHHFM